MGTVKKERERERKKKDQKEKKEKEKKRLGIVMLISSRGRFMFGSWLKLYGGPWPPSKKFLFYVYIIYLFHVKISIFN